MQIFIDESGDLGWKFDSRYQEGGSSRYLTIAFLITPNELYKHTKRLIRNFYNKFNIPTATEFKGSQLSEEQEIFIVDKTKKMLESYPDISISSITVFKPRVITDIQRDPNKLYNYMIGLSLLDRIKEFDEVMLYPDPRSIKVKSGNSLFDYLQIKLWFELSVATRLSIQYIPSENCYGLKFIDWIAHMVWSNYELGEKEYTKDLISKIDNKTLFFS